MADLRELTPAQVDLEIESLVTQIERSMPRRADWRAALMRAFELGTAHGGAFAVRHLKERLKAAGLEE